MVTTIAAVVGLVLGYALGFGTAAYMAGVWLDVPDE